MAKPTDTAALQRALDACGAGDCVYFPAGVYRSGALFGHSDMELYLAEGAVLQGAEEPEAYAPRIRSRFEGAEMECYASLLNFGTLDHTAGPNCRNVRIWGEGTIRGGGYALALGHHPVGKGADERPAGRHAGPWSRPARMRTPSPAGCGGGSSTCPTARMSAFPA